MISRAGAKPLTPVTEPAIGACVVLFVGLALLGQQSLFQGSVPTGVAAPIPLSLTGAVSENVQQVDLPGHGIKLQIGSFASGYGAPFVLLTETLQC